MGYHGASLRQIAKASEITLGTLYHYYPSKQDLLAELMSDALQPLIASGHEVRAQFAGDPRRQLYEAVRRFVLITLDAPQLAIIADVELRSLTGANAAQAVAMRDEYEGIIRSIVSEGAESGVFHPGDVKMVTFAVLAISNQPAYWFSAWRRSVGGRRRGRSGDVGASPRRLRPDVRSPAFGCCGHCVRPRPDRSPREPAAHSCRTDRGGPS